MLTICLKAEARLDCLILEGLFGCLLFVYFFLHLFIFQAIYIVLQDLRIKDAICRIKYQEG